MDKLFSLKGNFQVVRLSEVDARACTDHLNKLRELILENEPMYPDIHKWFDEKVVPGLKASERVGYVGYLDEKPSVSAVVKRGEDAKFCHLRIKKDLQDIHLGEAFFTLMGLDIRGLAKEIHFTLPESVWEKEKGFFKSFGFVDAIKAGHQYRLFEDELRCSTDFGNVWSAILEKFPKIARAFLMNGHSLDSKLVMSIRGENARKVVTGKKKVEIRRRFSKKWAGCKVSIYASGRERCLIGEASISKVVVGDPESIWENFHEEIGCTRAEFDNYTQPRGEVYAIVLEDAIPYRKSISLGEVSNLTKKKLQPPQTYYDLSKNRNWAEAVSMGALLHSALASQGSVLV